MKEALEGEQGFFPADTESAVVLEPGNGPLDGPSAFIAPQRPTVLSDGSIGPVGRYHFDPFFQKRGIKSVAIIGFVADDPFGQVRRQHETEEFLDERAFCMVGRGGVDGYWQPFGIDQNHDFDALADSRTADPIPSTLGFGESSVHKTLVESVAAFFFSDSPHGPHDLLEDAGPHPAKEPSVDAAFAAELLGQVFPLGPVIEDPKDPGDSLPFIRRRPSALRVGLKVRNQTFEKIELVFVKSKHRKISANPHQDARFWDSF